VLRKSRVRIFLSRRRFGVRCPTREMAAVPGDV
jgi:hypothetical protein